MDLLCGLNSEYNTLGMNTYGLFCFIGFIIAVHIWVK